MTPLMLQIAPKYSHQFGFLRVNTRRCQERLFGPLIRLSALQHINSGISTNTYHLLVVAFCGNAGKARQYFVYTSNFLGSHYPHA